MNWKQIVSSVLIFSISSIVTILSFKDFNIIKKESGIKFDVNQAFNKVFSDTFEKNPDSNTLLNLEIKNLQNKITFLEKTNLSLHELNHELKSKLQDVSTTSLLNDRWFTGGCIFVIFSCFILYKYLRLKKLHKNTLNLVNFQIETSKQVIELHKNFKIKNNELSARITQTNQNLQHVQSTLENENCVRFDKNSLKEKIKNCCFSSYLKSCKDFQLGLNCGINKSKLEIFQTKLDTLSIKWYNNLMKPVFFLSESTSNSVLLLSIVTSFILITYIDFNLDNILDRSILDSPEPKNVNVFVRSDENYIYDFLKIDDYIWENNKSQEESRAVIDKNFLKNKTYSIDKALEYKQKLLKNRLLDKKNPFI